jgi:hypothetical protein
MVLLDFLVNKHGGFVNSFQADGAAGFLDNSTNWLCLSSFQAN